MNASRSLKASGPPDDVAQLEAIAHEFTKAFSAGDVDSIMGFYGETYVDVNLRCPVQTRAERREYYRDAILRRGIQVEVRTEEILVEGPIGLIRGTINLTAADRSHTELRYLEVARKTSEGKWVVIWGMDGPVQDYEPHLAD